MPKHQNEKNSSRESQVCHLAQAGLTARIRQFGRPVLGGKLVIPYQAYINVFTWISLQTFFLPYESFKPTVKRLVYVY